MFVKPKFSLSSYTGAGYGWKIQCEVRPHGSTNDVNGIRWAVATGGESFATPTTTWTTLQTSGWSLQPGQRYDIVVFTTYLASITLTNLRYEISFNYVATS